MNAPIHSPLASIETAFPIAVEVDRNVIWIHYAGHFTADRMRSCRENVIRALAAMAPGFTVVTDLSQLESMEIDCVEDLARVMEAFRARGAGNVIRVVPDPEKDIGFNILSTVHYRGRVKVVTVESVVAAEQTLNQLGHSAPAFAVPF